MTLIRPISTARAPAPAGHYAQAVVHNGTAYISGILPWDPTDPSAPLGDMADQTRRVLMSLAAVLNEAGSDLEHLLQVTIFVTDLESWGAVNEVFAEFLGDHRPSRAVVPVLPLKRNAGLELMAIAAVPE